MKRISEQLQIYILALLVVCGALHDRRLDLFWGNVRQLNLAYSFEFVSEIELKTPVTFDLFFLLLYVQRILQKSCLKKIDNRDINEIGPFNL